VNGFTVVPRLFERDVFGGLLRYVERVYGATLGEDLFVLDYDWRQPLAHGARSLAQLIARVRGVGTTQVDLIGVSSGGNVIRSLLATDFDDPVLAPTPSAVNRIVYLGTPHRGNVSSFKYLQEGVEIVRQRAAAEALQARVPAMFDLLPHPSDRIFCDRTGATLDLDHLDPRVWRELRLVGHDRPELADDLARARTEHAKVSALPHPPSIVIADRHRPTVAKIIVDGGHVIVPCADCGDRDRYPYAFDAGDGVVLASSMAAAPSLIEDGPWWVTTSEHAKIGTDAHVRPLVVEALLSPLAPVPRERYVWPRNPAMRGVIPPEESELA
jgi:hypothetical protein